MNKNLQFHIGCLGHFSYNNTQREFINRNGDNLSSSFKKAVKLQIQVTRQFIDIIQKRPNITLETWGKRKIYEIKRPTMPFPKIKIKNLSHAYCKIYSEKSV
ncbi:MAG: hypothetical protein KTV77_01800 [Wolbachia endosymbiont of Fragariocoptes setiger]|nr:hypothetical protein [Wolbachia endosymbiont of Fragariocoptes setiger]